MGKPIIWNGANAKLINSGDLIDAKGNSLTNGGKANYTWTGHGLTVGGTDDIGRPVYVVDATTLAFADATLSANAEVFGFIYAVLDANTVRLIFAGEIPTVGSLFLEAGGSLVPGTVYFLSAASPGKVTATEPTAIGYISKPLGVATSTTRFLAFNMRGSVVGSTNARTQIYLTNNTTTPILDASVYEAGEITGWVWLSNSTTANTKRFYVSAPFSQYGGSSNYYISPSYVGDTPPAGFSITITAAGSIQLTLPNISGFNGGYFAYALNAPAVGTDFPLNIDGGSITGGTIDAAFLPVASIVNDGIVTASAQTFSGVKTFNSGLAFTSASLSDSQATIMGLKQYLHGTTYNGGIAPTVTCAQAGFSVTRATFLPYQSQDGAWRLKFHITSGFSSASVTAFTVSVNGIVFKNIANNYQVCSAMLLTGALATKTYCDPNTGNILTTCPATTATGISIMSDVELNAKPTWAY